MRKTSAKLRLDGEQTREALIEAAGVLAAEVGWPNVQAKHVCARAGVNTAAVNYWFGSRDALYEAVLAKIPDAMIDDANFVSMLQGTDLDEALDRCLDYLIDHMAHTSHWAIRVWAREVTGHPSEAFLKLARARGVTRVGGMRRFLGVYLGLDETDPRVSVALMSLMSMLFWMMTVSPEIKGVLLSDLIEKPQVMTEAVKNHLKLSLRALKAEVANA